MMLDQKAKLYAENILGESEETKKLAVKEIQNFLSEHPEIPLDPSDVRTIVIFLRGCKYRTDKTKKKIANYYQHRGERLEWFSSRNPHSTEIAELLQIGIFLPLLNKDEENRQIVVVRTGAHVPKNHKQNDVFKLGFMVMDYVMSVDDLTTIYGNRVIFDMSGVTLSHALALTPTIIKRAVQMWECYPMRMRNLEFVNAPFHVNVVLDIFRSFMSKKMKERVQVKRGLPDFNPNDRLPGELGGNGESYHDLAKHWQKIIVKNYDFFIKDV